MVTGGILAVTFDHILDRLRKPEANLVTNVSITADETLGDERVNVVTHQVLFRNDGDTVFSNLKFRIKFAPTDGKPTIGHPVSSAHPDAILDANKGKWSDFNVYDMDIDIFAPGAEVILCFDADQILSTTIDILGDKLQATRIYNQD